MDWRKTLIKGKRRNSIEKGLEKTVDEIIKAEKEEPSDRYFILKLKKQYKGLLRTAKKLNVDITNYENKLNNFYQN